MEDNKHHTFSISRRHFLKYSGVAASGIACSTLVSCDQPQPEGCGQIMPALAGYQPSISSAWVQKDMHEESYPLFKSVVDAATDFSWYNTGDKILLKLALNSGAPFPATTDAWSLACMIRYLVEEKGVEKENIIVGDQSGAEYVVWTSKSKRGASRALCKTAGLLQVIEGTGVTPCFFEERGYDAYFAAYPPEPHHWEAPLYISSIVNEVDHIIFLPRVGAHILGDISSGLKISVGFLRDDSRLQFHQGGGNFYAMYEEISQVDEIRNKLRLAVTSGRKVLTTIGPDFGHISYPEHGLIFASSDLLAHELLASAWLKYNYEHLTPSSAKAFADVSNFRSVINAGFTSIFFAGMKGQKIITPGLPINNKDNILCHQAILNCIKRTGGQPEAIIWQSANDNPDESVTQYLEDMIDPISV